MFPLNQKTFPKDSSELAAAISASLRRVFAIDREFVSAPAKDYPNLNSLTVDLSNATVTPSAARPTPARDQGQPALTIDRLEVRAEPLSLGSAALNLRLDAEQVIINQSRDESENIVLLLAKAGRGRIEISMRESDVETIVRQTAIAEAAKHGVDIDGVQLNLRAISDRAIAIEIALNARKLFVRARIKVSGEMEIDEQLVARITKLDCAGDGAIAGIACGVLEPHLEKLRGRSFPLMALPLGEVKIRDVRIDIADQIRVTADFGATTDGEA
jgi:hypothetical protein